ncbi:MAG: serine hydrolase, partial [Planctomycetota bacterium]|nr:serine hydrolase [Planctomycetota bacterium]
MKTRFLALFMVMMLSPLSAYGEEKLAGDWEGSLTAGGRVLKIEIQFFLTSRGLKALLHVPHQKARNIPLTNIIYDAPTVHFERRQGNARAVFHGELKKGTIQGTFIQGKVVGRFLLKPKANEKTETLDSLKPRYKALSETYSLTIMELGDSPSTVAQVHSGTPTSIGTCSTLYVMGALVSDIKAGKKRWNDVIQTKEQYLSLPAGVLQTWPVGSPITLQSAATFMMSLSDNTATDHLLFSLGRKRVEAQQKLMGNKQSRGPFLSTFELFYLKNQKTQSETKKYLGLKIEEKRKFLAGLGAFDRKAIQFPRTPYHINSIEWFASTKEICLALDWLRKETEDPRVKAARDILAIKAG